MPCPSTATNWNGRDTRTEPTAGAVIRRRSTSETAFRTPWRRPPANGCYTRGPIFPGPMSEALLIRTVRERGMAGTQGFEPRYAAPEAAVLPLDDVPIKAKPHFTRRGAANPLRQSSKLEDHNEALVAGERPAVPVRLGRLGRRLEIGRASCRER